jgi:dethiobiotin synthetase
VASLSIRIHAHAADGPARFFAIVMNLFVTGTDTDVGKTWVSAALVRAWRAAGVDAVGLKPIGCGGRDDAELLHAASDGVLTLDEVNPVWLQPPLAPYAAAMVEERFVDLGLVRDIYARLAKRHRAVVVEGAGGWLVPILRDYAVSDLAAELSLPVLVVAANRLGVLNHTLLTVESILAKGLRCAGVLLNQVAVPAAFDAAAVTNPGILEDLLMVRGVHYLGEMEHGCADLPARALEILRAGCEL